MLVLVNEDADGAGEHQKEEKAQKAHGNTLPSSARNASRAPVVRRANRAPLEGLKQGQSQEMWKIRSTLSRRMQRASAMAPASVRKPGRTKSSASTRASSRRYILNLGSPNSSLYMSL